MAKDPADLNPQLARAVTVFEELTDGAQSDRAIAILGFAVLEDGLSDLARAVIVRTTSRDEKDLLSGFGFLSTAAAKIEMLFRFGILPRLTYSDLTLMRKIRNDFAHSSAPGLRFDSTKTDQLSSVQEMVDFLKPKGWHDDWWELRLHSPRGRFEAHAVGLNHDLSTIQAVVTRRTPPASPVWA